MPQVINFEKSEASKEIPLAQFIEEEAIVRVFVCGKWDKDYCVVTDEAKFLVSSLFQELSNYHQEGYCILDFNQSNVDVVTDTGRAKLKDLKLLPRSVPLIRQNYRDAFQILEKTVFAHNPVCIPEDVKILLELMKSDDVEHLGYLITKYCTSVASVVFEYTQCNS